MVIRLTMGRGNGEKKAFAALKPELFWDDTAPDYPGLMEPYFPYLVRFEDNQNGGVSFFGVDLRTGETIPGKAHWVKIGDDRFCWSDLPSTLEGFDKYHPYAILFLSDRFERIKELKAAKGGGKYPKSLGSVLDKLKVDLKEFRGLLTDDKTRADFEKAFGEYLEDE